ncbi:pyridoxal phosphate-dependent aminotransferase [bacterium]|nr:pyridoxal phosphate-dependent aminotransferase [bacterium]
MISQKIKDLKPSATLAINRKSKEMQAKGLPVINLSVGEPDFDTPQPVKECAIQSINEGFTKYTVEKGTVELREEICKKLQTDNNLSYDPEHIIVSNGAKHSLFNTFLAIIEPGDEVIIPAPYWVSYPAMVNILGGVPVFCRWDKNFKIDIEHLKSLINNKTKALVLNSPSNPTGVVYNKKELEAISEVLTQKGVLCISDEIYEKIIYNKEHISIASLSPEMKKLTVVINGVSKSFAMTGWRIGYTASEPEISAAIAKIQGQTTSAPSSISQKAAYSAIKYGEQLVAPMVKEFKKRRDYLLENLSEKFVYPMPDGAFYLFFTLNNIDSVTLANQLLEEKLLATVPCQDFGADKYVRISYATSLDNLKEAVKRLNQVAEEKGN